MSRLNTYRTAGELEAKIDEYFTACAETGNYPDEAGMLLHIGISRKTYEKYLKGATEKDKTFAECLNNARLRRESIIVREIYDSDKSPTGKIFLARQACNGGLLDKPREEVQGTAVEIKISGADTGRFD